jgi:hypothetical protein
MREKRHTDDAEFTRDARRRVTENGDGVGETARHLGNQGPSAQPLATSGGNSTARGSSRSRARLAGTGRMTPATPCKSASAAGTRRVQKSAGRRCPRVERREALLAEPPGIWPVSRRCEVREVCRRGVDDDLSRQAGAESEAEALAVFARVKASAAGTRHRDGRRRLATPLQDAGFAVGRAQARRWLHQAGVAGPRPTRRGPVTTDRRPGDEVAPNRRARQVDGAPPAHVWGGESSSVGTGAGWLSGSTRLDW